MEKLKLSNTQLQIQTKDIHLLKLARETSNIKQIKITTTNSNNNNTTNNILPQQDMTKAN